ncbi:hypothetical protein FS842_004415 [Serendipita sp. 407]|nr:hypothetical protein FS842_004415 [Serendipita sp. 407]
MNSAIMYNGHAITSRERDDRRTSIDQHTALVHTALNGILKSFNESRNTLAPISILTDDVLIEIWSYNYLKDRFSIPQVCRRWRQLSLGASHLWAELDFSSFPTRKLYMLLKRARQSPLHVTATSAPTYPVMPILPPNPEHYDPDDFVRCGHGCGHALLRGDIPDADNSGIIRNNVTYPLRDAFPAEKFNEIVQRSKSLEATLGDKRVGLPFTYENLLRPMPYLHCLSLNYSSGGFGSFRSRAKRLDFRKLTAHWFQGTTPRLRELYLNNISAPCDDQIYFNLTHLRLNLPPIKFTTHQLLRILARCPRMEYLDLIKCFDGDLVMEEHSVDKVDDDREEYALPPLVELKHLWYLHFDEVINRAFSDFFSRIACPELETLVICASDMSCFDSMARSVVLQDQIHSTGLLGSLFPRTSQLQFSFCPSNQFTAVGRINERAPHNTTRRIRKAKATKESPGIGWSFSCTVAPYPPSDPGMNYNQAKFLLLAESLGLSYTRIELVQIKSTTSLDDDFYRDIFTRCTNLKCLKLHPQSPPSLDSAFDFGSPYESYDPIPHLQTPLNPKEAMKVLTGAISSHLCPQLGELHLKGAFGSLVEELTQWLQSRAERHHRLRLVVVEMSGELMFDTQVVTEKARAAIESALEYVSPTVAERSGLVWIGRMINRSARIPREKADLGGRGPEEEEYQTWLRGT